MGLRDNSFKGVIKSFANALHGIVYTIYHERNMKVHLIITLVVLCTSVYFHITKFEWIIILLIVGGMLSLEVINTAIEKTVDLITSDFHPLAKVAKDVAAGAALIFAIISIIIGLIIFLPYFFET